MTKYLHNIIRSFPREHKYSLGREILDLSWRCLDLVVEINILPNDRKAEKIAELAAAFKRLKMRLRMSQEINLISINQFAHLQEQFIAEMEKMAGGWAKWADSVKGGL